MKSKRVIYQRFTALDNIVEISIPKSFNIVLNQDNKNCTFWTNGNKETVTLYKLEQNQYPLRDIIQMARKQMAKDKCEIKNLGVYSCVNKDIEKLMSEDELICGESNSYIVSCGFRYKDMSFVIYYTGNIHMKSVIKENMLYIMDSIRINTKE